MNMSDDIRKTLTDPKPLYALAGAGDLAAEKLKDAPDRFKDAPALLAEASAALSTLATRIAAEAPEHLAKVSATVQDTVGKASARPDTAALRDRAQTVALQQVGRLLEAAGKAVETYDELAERGKVVVGRYTGTGEPAPGEAEPAVTVVVEQLSDEDELTGAEQASATLPEDEPESAAEAAAVFLAADDIAEEAEEPGASGAEQGIPGPKKAPRRRATAPKTAQADQSEA